jgi:hypothetical protein
MGGLDCGVGWGGVGLWVGGGVGHKARIGHWLERVVMLTQQCCHLCIVAIECLER